MGRGAGYGSTAGRRLELTTGDANADFVACEADSGDGQKEEKGASPKKSKSTNCRTSVNGVIFHFVEARQHTLRNRRFAFLRLSDSLLCARRHHGHTLRDKGNYIEINNSAPETYPLI